MKTNSRNAQILCVDSTWWVLSKNMKILDFLLTKIFVTASWKSHFDFLGYLKIFPNKSSGDVNQSCRAWIGLSSAFYRSEIRWCLGELWRFKVPAVNSRILSMHYFRILKLSTIRRKWLSGSQPKGVPWSVRMIAAGGSTQRDPKFFLQKLVKMRNHLSTSTWGFWSQKLKFFLFAQKRR